MTLGGQREVRGGQGGVGEGTQRPKKKIHLVRFKIMGLCGGFRLLLKRPELMLNEVFDDIFSESSFLSGFFGCYIYTKISGFFFR